MGSRIGVWSADGRPCLPMSSIRLVLGGARARLSMSLIYYSYVSQLRAYERAELPCPCESRHRLRKGEEETDTAGVLAACLGEADT